MPPRFLLFLVKTNVINVNSRVRKIIVPLMSITCSEMWVCSYSILKGRWSWELMETENRGVKQHRPRAMFAVCYVELCKADRSFTTTYEQTKTRLTFWHRDYFFLILAHSVYKMWIIQEPNTLELWNKLRFEEKKNREYITCLKYSVPIFVE